ncbi:MAG: aldehyde dehydrogenase family protein, partial [Thermocrispum sp.]
MTGRISHWIEGKPWSGVTQRAGDVYDPATGQVASRVDFAGQPEIDAAVAGAQSAFPAWRDASLAARSRVLFEFRRLLHANRDRLAEIVTAEHGKVHDDALGEVGRALEAVEFACGAPALLKGGFSENVSTDVDVYSLRQPLGVVGVISPFNFPAMVPMWFIPNALACGNAVVLKPSEKDPSAANFIAELWRDAGLPDGLLTVLHGDKVAVDGLLTHQEVQAISFVGSTPVARYIYETGTANGKRVQALGGAKNHMVVLPDADIDMAADAAVSAAYGSAGERCMA